MADPAADALSPRLLAQAPHRLMFFVGASNLLLAMVWWTAWLAAARWPGLAMPQPTPYAGWLHAFVMQYQVLPSFIFGFLLTTFPRWMGLPEFERWRYLPVGIGLFGGQLATLLGAMGWEAGIVVGLLMTIAGWSAGLVTLAPLLPLAVAVAALTRTRSVRTGPIGRMLHRTRLDRLPELVQVLLGRVIHPWAAGADRLGSAGPSRAHQPQVDAGQLLA